ncbi:restriction endonuclease subunit S [Blautia glucerasea]|uniref:restriction endonuclease subunit S n=1 Tax=Lachnospiraceae TaxID=186803 RepID=UPI00156E8232|nr:MULTISPECIES: restriction endonuclease subunit S [Lachnospiraceae]MCG4537318.1 restriction endonuclease subunit S [Mediterraneibacter faecis]NSD37979.1 restriction endonuclease subunit S [Blautia glucerasea]NSG43723.1 restriction endonuclease subunit S [Coprococcus comes]
MKSNYDILGNHIRLIDTRNRESITDRVLGINIDKFFMPSVANVIGTDLSKYKLITKGKFACNPMHVGRDERLPVALYDEEEAAIVSPAYFMFEVVDNSILNEDYLMMWFRRPEFDRICWLHTDGSVRGGITWDDICRLELPIPPIEKQLEIVNSYKAITERIALKKKINDNLEAQAEAIYNEMIANNSTNGTMSTLGEISTIKTGKLNSEAAVINGIYPFFTCSQETYRTNTFSFDQEAVLLAGNNASAIYPLKIYCGKFDVYQRTYVISSNNRFVSNKQLYFVLKQQLNEFKGISSGTTTKFLTMKILTPIPVVIAPEDIATSFINITNKIFETIFQNQREIEHLRELQMIVLGELSRD